ncbi:outer membrane beta-barrel protein [Spirosoma jeollabukense]
MKTNVYQALILLLITATLASAQSRFALSITGGPVVNHASMMSTVFLPDQNGQLTSTTIDSRSTTYGHVLGVSAHYSFTPDWSMSTGFWYNRLSMNGTNPFNSTPLPTRIIAQTIQVPLFVNYRPGRKRLSPYFSAGTLANFPQSTIYRDQSNTGQGDLKITFNKKTTFQAVVGAGVAYTLNTHLSLTAQPMLIWRFKPAGDYERYVAYQVNGQLQLMYSF